MNQLHHDLTVSYAAPRGKARRPVIACGLESVGKVSMMTIGSTVYKVHEAIASGSP